jgi:hypothetical protein
MHLGTFWHCIDNVWRGTTETFAGYYEKFKGLRYNKAIGRYIPLHHLLQPAEGVKAINEDDSLFQRGSSYFGSSVRTGTTDEIAKREENKGNRGSRENHMKSHLKTIGGMPTATNNKSKAHLLPKDKECNVFWWKIIQFVIGDGSRSDAVKSSVLANAAEMATNKLVFVAAHNHIF